MALSSRPAIMIEQAFRFPCYHRFCFSGSLTVNRPLKYLTGINFTIFNNKPDSSLRRNL